MVQAYNFLASWQLFPEKGNYEWGERPRSGIYKIESAEENKELRIINTWVTLENLAFSSEYRIIADGGLHEFDRKELADQSQATFIDSINFEIHFYRGGQVTLHIVHEIMPNGYLKITQQGISPG